MSFKATLTHPASKPDSVELTWTNPENNSGKDSIPRETVQELNAASRQITQDAHGRSETNFNPIFNRELCEKFALCPINNLFKLD